MREISKTGDDRFYSGHYTIHVSGTSSGKDLSFLFSSSYAKTDRIRITRQYELSTDVSSVKVGRFICKMGTAYSAECSFEKFLFPCYLTFFHFLSLTFCKCFIYSGSALSYQVHKHPSFNNLKETI